MTDGGRIPVKKKEDKPKPERSKRQAFTTALVLLAAVVVAGVLLAGRSSGELAARLAALSGEVENGVRGELLGPLTLIPPLVTIVLAFLTKEVLTSLLAGGLSGAALLVASQAELGGWGGFLLNTLHKYCITLVDVLAEPENTAIIVLCLCIGGLTNLIREAGGFNAVARKLVTRVRSPRQAQFMTSLMALMFFFDDYADALIVGPVMRPITDQARVSREKLAFMVDSTAAPVAGIALISSWIAAELAAIEAGFEVLGVTGVSAYNTFLGSIPYCFYNIFCLTFILWMVVMGRDYGPMYKAECRARAGVPVNPERSETDQPARQEERPVSRSSLFIAVGSILFLCVYAVAGIYSDGLYKAKAAGLLARDAGFSFETLRVAFGQASTVQVLVEAALLTALLAALVAVATRALSFDKAVGAWVEGGVQLLTTALILALAWALSAMIAELGSANYLAELLAGSLPYWMLPSLVFLVCCAVSFSAGSYGCMLMIMPMVVPIAYTIAYSDSAVQNPWGLFCACVASVLAGSIFGDHCSPVTDTTILSAQGSGCALLDHVKTQMPYALTVAATATLLGTLPAGLGVSPALSLPLGMAVLALVLFKFGKHPVPAGESK